MPCFHPKPAWQARLGAQLSFTYVRNWRCISVPCNTCAGCIQAQAQAWAFRCHLESIQHPFTAFTTLTYAKAPWTLDKQHLTAFLKRLRDRILRNTEPHTLGHTGRLKFFASGEYGSYTHRPHYHVLLFGLDAVGPHGARMVEEAWGQGHTRTSPASPARIAYAAAYTAKKSNDKFLSTEWADPETGEAWQPPFFHMSRRPGLGSHARDEYLNSWRAYAIHDGNKLPVPRYLHNAWRKTATEEQLLQLQSEKEQYIHNRDNSQARLNDAERIMIRKQQLQGQDRDFLAIRSSGTSSVPPERR